MEAIMKGAVAVSVALGLSIAGYTAYHSDKQDSYQVVPKQPQRIVVNTDTGETITGWPSASKAKSGYVSRSPQLSGGRVPPTSTDSSQLASNTTATTSVPVNTQPSSNWAGYVAEPVSGHSYTSVSGTWKVPAMGSGQDGAAAQWIGLGGVSSNDLLQMGTVEQAVNGAEQAEVFWEKLPDTAQSVMTVPIGSTIHVDIQKAAGLQWNLKFSATTPSGQTVTRTIKTTLSASYAKGIGTSAEWISEDPSDANGTLYPLAGTNQVQFTGDTVDHQAVNAKGNSVEPMALVSTYGSVLIAPSKLGASGETFSTQTVGTQHSAGGYYTVGVGQGRTPGNGDSWTQSEGNGLYHRPHSSYRQYADSSRRQRYSVTIRPNMQSSTTADSEYTRGYYGN